MNRLSLYKYFPLLILAVAGCQSSTGPNQNSSPPAGLKTETEPSDQLIYLPPTITVEDGVLNISGYLHRKPGVTDEISGRVDVDFVAADGSSLGFLPLLMTPDPVPTEGLGESAYMIHYGWIPPEGTTIHIHFVDKKQAIAEDNGDNQTYGKSNAAVGYQSGSTAGRGNRNGWFRPPPLHGNFGQGISTKYLYPGSGGFGHSKKY